MRIEMHHYIHFDPVKVEIVGESTATDEALTAPTETVQEVLKEIRAMSGAQSQLQQEVDALTATTTAQTTVLDSAITYIQGVPALVQTAVQSAIAAGAPPETLQAVNDVINTLSANNARVTAALQANTPQQDTTGGGASVPGSQQP